ncbi:hypothetical protein Tco_0740284 [Tanacetum coccineum]
MKVFPLSLADDARQWWINKGKGIITTWEELVDKFFCKCYPCSYDGEDEMLDDGDNWGIDPLEFISLVDSSFKKHRKVDGRTKKEDQHLYVGHCDMRKIMAFQTWISKFPIFLDQLLDLEALPSYSDTIIVEDQQMIS